MAANDGKIEYICEKLDDVSDAVACVDKEVVAQRVAFEEHMKQDERMYEEFKRMNDTLMQNTQSLKEHMDNNHLLKEMILRMDNRLQPLVVKDIERTAVREWLKGNAIFVAKLLGAVGGAVMLAMLVKSGLVLLIK